MIQQGQVLQDHEITYIVYDYLTDKELFRNNSTIKIQYFLGRRCHPKCIADKYKEDGGRASTSRRDGTKCYIKAEFHLQA